MEMVRSMLHAQNLKKPLSAEAVVNAAYTRNPCPSKGIAVHHTRGSMEWEKALHFTHVCVWMHCVCHGARREEGKLDAKGTKCLFLGYCEGTKAYRLMCVQSKKIIKCRDVEFMEDSTSVGNDLEMHPSGRNETPNVVIVDSSSKSPYVDDDAKEDPSNEEVTPTPRCSSTPSTPS